MITNSSVERALSIAKDFVADRKPANALEPLLEAWRATHAPRIANLIDQVSLRADLGDLLNDDLEDEDGHEQWLSIANMGHPQDFWRLLLSIGEDDYRIALSRARFEALATQNDPRLATALCDMLRCQSRSLWYSNHAYAPKRLPGCAKVAFALETIAKLNDSRTLPLLRSVIEHESSTSSNLNHGDLKNACQGVVRRIGEPVALSRELTTLCETIEQRLQADEKAEHQAFNQALFCDIDARMVYADWLCERGDTAWGEFISHHISGEEDSGLPAELLGFWLTCAGGRVLKMVFHPLSASVPIVGCANASPISRFGMPFEHSTCTATTLRTAHTRRSQRRCTVCRPCILTCKQPPRCLKRRQLRTTGRR